MVEPDWPAPPRVRALVTTRDLGDLAGEAGRRALRAHLPSEPLWLRQVHGTDVIAVDESSATRRGMEARCHANLERGLRRADRRLHAGAASPTTQASVVGVAHAGWRGLAAGVLEATVHAMRVPPDRLLAWLGPAIGPTRVRGRARMCATPFRMRNRAASCRTRPGHWLLDLYGVARRALAQRGVTRVYGGGFCTYTDSRALLLVPARSHERAHGGVHLAHRSRGGPLQGRRIASPMTLGWIVAASIAGGTLSAGLAAGSL